MTAAPDLDPDHRRDCPGAVLGTFIGRLGDTITRCISCGRIKVHPTPEQAEPEQAEPEETPTDKPATGYVCREHYHPVSWRGKGCPRCPR